MADDPAPEVTTAEGDTEPAASRHVWVLVALVGAVAVPLLTAAAVLGARGWSPVGEYAQAELRLRDFWAHPPTLGAVARLRAGSEVASHPGPLHWWGLYPAYALGGRSAVAMSTSVALVALGWSAGILALLWRRGGDAFAVVGAVALLVLLGVLGPLRFVEPWNPWVALLPFAFCCLAVWDLSCGHRWSLPLAALSGTWCVHAHLGYAPLVAALCLLGAVWLAIALRSRPRELLVPAAVTLAVLGLTWAPTVAQEVRGDPGNLTVLREAWAAQEDTDEPLGLWSASRMVVAHLGPSGAATLSEDSRPTERGPDAGSLVVVAGWAAAVVVATRRRGPTTGLGPSGRGAWSDALRLLCVAGVAAVAAVATASRIVGDVYGYLVAWIAPVAAVALLGVLRVAWLSARDAGPPWPRRLPVLGAASVVVACGLVTATFADPPTPGGANADVLAALVPPTAAALDTGEVLVVRFDDPLAFGGVGTGMLSELERRGLQVGADPFLRTEVRPHRVVDPAEASQAVWVVTGSGIDDWRSVPGAREVAEVDPRDPGTRRRAQQLAREVRAELRTLGGEELAEQLDENYWVARSDPRVDDALAARIDRLAGLGLPTAVFLAPPGATRP